MARSISLAILILATIDSALVSLAFGGDIPSGYPVKADFPGASLKTVSQDWSADRSPGRGGKNYGIDNWAPEDMVIVEWDARETSCISCKGGRDVRLIFKDKGAIKFPAGVHVGTRIDTGLNPVGHGGSYTGTITYSYVPYKEWKKVLLEKYSDD